MDLQKAVFDWISNQPALTGLTVAAAGFLYGFCGYRMIRFLVILPMAGLGCLLGLLLSGIAGLPLPPALAAGALLGVVIGIAWRQGAIMLVGGATWAALGGYLATQFDWPDMVALIVAALFGTTGLVLTAFSRAPMIVLFTTLQGATLIVIGFVGLSDAFVPSLAGTFRGLASSQAVAVPLLILMISVTAFSYQASARQGDLYTGMRSQPRA